MGNPWNRPTFVPAVFYTDAFAALDWLEKAFGFERTMVITDADGNLAHGEMSFGGGLITVGSAWADYTVAPDAVGGRNTQVLHVHLEEDVDAHCERARAAGAPIVRPLEDQFYGERTYSARDPGGHVWSFGQTKSLVTREDAEKASGLKIEGWPDL